MKLQTTCHKIVIILLFFSCISLTVRSQSVLGTWQLIKQTNCVEDNLSAESDSMQGLINDMKNMSSPAPQVIQFKEKGAGEESTRILNKKKTANNKNFLYKFNGETLLILDKKSQTITGNYSVDKISTDSLILSNVSQACETKIFLKIKEPRSN